MRESLDLYRRRDQMDWLSVARPPCIGLLKRFLNWMKYHILEKGKMASLISSSVGLSRMFSNVVEGLPEIQLNNLQEDQLAAFDAMAGARSSFYFFLFFSLLLSGRFLPSWGAEEELSHREGVTNFVERVWTAVSMKGVIESLSEAVVVHAVSRFRS